MVVGRSNLWRTIRLLIMVSFISMDCLSYQSDTILPGQSIHANQTIISRQGVFELGFFSPGNSSKFYVGIWYKSIPSFTVVWVANRDTPILSSARDDVSLILTREGNLQLQLNSRIIWNTNTTTADLSTAKAVLLDSGNLVVGSNSSPSMWESFNHPTDTWLPGSKIGLDTTTNKTNPTNLTSWRKQDDPGSGIHSFGIDLSGSNDLLIINTRTVTIMRISTSCFSGMNQESKLNITFNVRKANGVHYVTYSKLDDSAPIKVVLDSSGLLRQLIWNEVSARWLNLGTMPKDYCESNATCGSNGICSTTQSPACSCPPGFQAKSMSDWELSDYSGGCVRKNESRCLGDKDEFLPLDNVKWPQNYQVLSFASADVCRSTCAADCGCSAYSNTSGCYLWFGDLLGMEQPYNTTVGSILFLRLGSNGLPKKEKGARRTLLIILAPSLSILILVLGFLSYYVYRKKIMKGAKDTGEDLLLFNSEMIDEGHISQMQSNGDPNRENRDLVLPMFSLSSVLSATDNFSSSNKLGEGGFGPVYKGKLHNGQEVAVKRLSKHSGQGLDELINEVKLIANLQHTNLVRLLGCCIQQHEKILIYEYMPNKSLDFFLYDPDKKEILDWSRRMHIIEGIAQGLLYLHHYSRIRIIHRDLKASNILLDADMKPRISDFGMARIFGGDQQENTRHVVGTIGYIPPEYALKGLFSVKTDIFSFGVLLLEILSGKRNTPFRDEDCFSLVEYAWKLWRRDTPLELIDPILKTYCNLSLAVRYVHVGLLCVQEHPDDRPNISDVIAMIGNEMKVIEVQPKQPAYFARISALEVYSMGSSLNDLTYSLHPR